MIKLKSVAHPATFGELLESFEKWLVDWSPLADNHPVADYFGEGLGLKRSVQKLFAEGILDTESDFRGIYLFLKKGRPFYAGISKHVVERLIQHVKGTNHFSSSLSYKLGADEYLRRHGEPHDGGREGLNFEEYAEPGKSELMKCNFAVFPVENELELYLFEVFVAMRLETLYYNEFRTH